ncbi:MULTISPECIES: hypothetical protein [unclassified Mesorhizobium]|uniref:hypothetical protein n=1 Tax=unclassified Mesorhizobium TaxID=325217 RepID=UPI0011410D76|nr:MULTISPECIES: hypothetical protein [unclassified Mesorhizobium]
MIATIRHKRFGTLPSAAACPQKQELKAYQLKLPEGGAHYSGMSMLALSFKDLANSFVLPRLPVFLLSIA